jgi:hypothetical protein
MATTYTLISSVTVGSGGAANIEFTSIPATYTDLLVRISTRSNFTTYINDPLLLTLNSSTSNFTGIYLTASNTSTFYGGFGRYAGDSNTQNGSSTSNTFSNIDVYLPNYASSNNKSFSVDTTIESNTVGTNLGFLAGSWSNSSAITSLRLTSNNSSTLLQYSSVYLYGISNA